MAEIVKDWKLPLWMMLFLACAGCGAMWGPSAERMNCLDLCADYKNDCMLNAQTANEITTCDTGNKQCVTQCPQ
ncbi:MAG: hypothetical protein JXR76_19770 [Deltaproteobacteria bacterium]|nr:hypothetical protein [Deltaproteobacteria bacterium]